MPRTTLSTAAAAVELVSDWTRETTASRFAVRLREDGTGAFAGFSLTAAADFSEKSFAAVPQAEPRPETDAHQDDQAEKTTDPGRQAEEKQALLDTDTALKRIHGLLQPLADRRVLVRTWLDVSVEVEVLSGAVAGHVVIRQFQLTGVFPDSATRAPDGTCHVRVFAHVARLENTGEEELLLPLALVPRDASSTSRTRGTSLKVEFAAGQWDAYLVSVVRLNAATSGPHELQLRAPEGQILCRLALTVHSGGVTTGTGGLRDDGDGGDGSEEEDGSEQYSPA